jgi:predicted dehydrogenase
VNPPPEPTRIRTAVIGTGFVGPHHVDAVRRGGYAEVVALVGSDEGRARERARALGVERGTADLGSILADASIDVVHVCTPNRTHVEIATAALEAGKHIVVEKPVALDSASAHRLAALARRLDRHAMVALTYRGYPMIRQARRMVAGGALGELRLIDGGYVQDWLADPAAWNWRIDPSASGPSRAIADIGTHLADTVEFVSGQRIEAVFADLATFIPIRPRPNRERVAFEAAPAGDDEATTEVTIETEDAATLLVRMEGGARGSFIVSQVSPGRKNAFTFELAGSTASLRWEQEDPERLWLGRLGSATVIQRGQGADGEANVAVEPVAVEPDAAGAPGAAGTPGVPTLPAGHAEGWGGALRDVLRPFYAAIAAGAPVPGPGESAGYPTLDDGARGVAFVEAVLTAARDSRWTPIEPSRR